MKNMQSDDVISATYLDSIIFNSHVILERIQITVLILYFEVLVFSRTSCRSLPVLFLAILVLPNLLGSLSHILD